MTNNKEIYAVLYSILYFSIFISMYPNFVDKPILAMVLSFLVALIFYGANQSPNK